MFLNKICKRKIVQYDLKGNVVREWNGYSDIEIEMGFNRGAIYQCCHGKIKQAYGYRWSFI